MKQIGPSTRLYGIIGHPVAHSLSPVMHNAAFRARGLDAVYLAFDVTDIEAAIQGVRAIGIKGLSVTVPHKESVLSLMDHVDERARKIGAVNTIVNREDGLLGANTDWLGAVKALEEHAGELQGKKALVIGAGGAAKAIVAGLIERGARVHVANRTILKAEALSKAFGTGVSGLDDIPEDEFTILINATTMGMGDKKGLLPVSPAVIERTQYVMDIVYAPLETELLRTAKKMGKHCINGLRMLLFQACAQFELWTGLEAPEKVMEQALMGAIRGLSRTLG